MTIFDNIAYTYQRLKKAQDKLLFLEMQAGTPRSSIISDTPKGGGGLPSNPIEQYAIKKEEAETRVKMLTNRLNNQWAAADRLMKTANIEKQSRKMMFFRFYRGLQWEKCASEMQKLYPENKWNVNKCFRKYRDVLCRTRKVDKNK